MILKKLNQVSLHSVSIGIYGQNKTIHIHCREPPPQGGKARVQNDIFGSFVDVIFKYVAHKEPAIWRSPSHSYFYFYQGKLAAAFRVLEFVQFLYKLRYE